MSMFTLAISCLTVSNLPCLMDLTFQVPMQYCSLRHQTLLQSPVTSTTGCCFLSGSILSFFLELFLHSSPVVFGHLPTKGVQLSVSYLFAFSHVYGLLNARIMKWFDIPFSSGPCFSELSTITHPFWIALHSMAQFHWVRQGWGPCDQFG